MKERRAEPRLLCADLVNLCWQDADGKERRLVANLEDISSAGACLQTDVAIPPETPVRIEHPNGALTGRVRYCIYREIGYFLGIQFEAGCRWSEKDYQPQHLLDPRSLVPEAAEQDPPPPPPVN